MILVLLYGHRLVIGGEGINLGLSPYSHCCIRNYHSLFVTHPVAMYTKMNEFHIEREGGRQEEGRKLGRPAVGPTHSWLNLPFEKSLFIFDK